tara:strand:- start:412 stop:846 length:435 start_codon:yes stop_codon:yes gene_type:complete
MDKKINPFYLGGLNKKDINKHKKNILTRRKKYKKYKSENKTKKDKYKKNTLESYKNKKSKHVINFEKKYKIKITNSKKIEKQLGISEKAQFEIIKKGKGAFFSSGSRPNQTPHSWAYGRLASVILKKGAYKYDKHILEKYKIKL